MRFATLRRPRAGQRPPGVVGAARLDRRTTQLTKRLRPGDVAIIDHVDLDRVAAEALVGAQVGAVVNVAPSVSGRYPNLGPQILVAAGIPLVDGVGTDIFAEIREGDRVRVFGGTVYADDDRVVATGTAQTGELLDIAMSDARAGLGVQLEAFASNTAQYLRREHALLLDGVGVPDLTTPIEGRHVVVVVRGYDCQRELVELRRYIREFRPVLIAVDAGADALLEAGLAPDVIVGDMDSVSEEALRTGAELVVHARRDGGASGLVRAQELGMTPVVFPGAGTSEDVALLLADHKGASLVVTVGTHATLVELLDKGRSGMASTFLTRLRLGGKLVDAKAVIRIHRSRAPSRAPLLLLIVAMLIAFAVLLTVAPDATSNRHLVDVRWHDAVHWLHGLFG